VYVYERSGGTWTFAQKLIASHASAGSTFGSALALDGNVLAVGAASQSTAGFDRQGATYVFERTAGVWQETDKLLAASPANLEGFGRALALDGDTLLVGAPRNDDNCPFPADCNTGAVYVFERGLVSWIGTGILYASDVAPEPAFFDQRFGRSVAISGERALVGAYGDDELGMDAGAVYAFEHGFAGWSPTQKIFSPSPTPLQDRFGLAVAIDAGRAAVGAPFDDGDVPLSGAVFVLDLAPGGAWIVGAELRPSDGAAFDDFGSGVDVAGGTVLAGAHYHDAGAGAWSGAAYVYDLERLGTSYCVHTASSLGVPATLGAFGSDSVGTNALTLRAEPVPDQPGLFFFGQVQAQLPFGNGFLCIGPPQVRIEPPLVPVSGVATRSVDLAFFGIVPGTYDFQYWFRDPAAGGAFFNLADAVEVVFGP